VILVVAATQRELAGVEHASPGARGVVCGVGPVDAAAATAAALARDRPEALLNVGVAGCRRGCDLAPPALVLGSEAVYCDVGAGGPAAFQAEARAAPDAGLLERARGLLPEAQVRPIATSARLGGGAGCDVEAMEGFAVLRAAALAHVPALELRTIANEVEELDRGRWRVEEALEALAAATARLLEGLL
jgi:futalosine hydrolase